VKAWDTYAKVLANFNTKKSGLQKIDEQERVIQTGKPQKSAQVRAVTAIEDPQ
jgi:hypothetical protein